MSVQPAVWTPPVQWGSATAGVWTNIPPLDDPTGDIRLVTGGTTGGVIFDAGFDTAFVGGDERALDPPVIVTFQFHLHPIAEDIIGPWIFEVGLVPDPQPADYSTALLPWARGETVVLTENLDQPPLAPIIGVDHHETGFLDSVNLRATITSRARWNGRIAFSFRSTGVSVVRLKNGPNFSFEASVTQEQFYSGVIGGPMGRGIRAVRDGRFGFPSFNTELVRDGDNPGLFVRQSDQDPEDPPATYRPKPGEGSVDDEVPNL